MRKINLEVKSIVKQLKLDSNSFRTKNLMLL